MAGQFAELAGKLWDPGCIKRIGLRGCLLAVGVVSEVRMLKLENIFGSRWGHADKTGRQLKVYFRLTLPSRIYINLFPNLVIPPYLC